MSIEETIERVAEALYYSECELFEKHRLKKEEQPTWDSLSNDIIDMYRSKAAIALSALHPGDELPGGKVIARMGTQYVNINDFSLVPGVELSNGNVVVPKALLDLLEAPDSSQAMHGMMSEVADKIGYATKSTTSWQLAAMVIGPIRRRLLATLQKDNTA